MRRVLDRLDGDIVRLLNKRAAQAVRIGKEKRRKGLPLRDPAREAEVAERVRRANGGPLSDGAVDRIYRVIIRACTALQGKSAGK